MTLLIKFLFVIAFLAEHSLAKESTRDELNALNPCLNAKYYVKIPSETPELSPEAIRAARTVRFATNAATLEKKFQKFHLFTHEQREELLDKYEERIVNMGRKMRITREGLDDCGFDVSEETARKIKYILTFYKGRETASCTLF